MKSCPHCGAQYPDDAVSCTADGSSLGLSNADRPASGGVSTASVRCPSCGAADDYSPTMELRGSFSLLVFLAGGLLAVIFRNAGRGKRVRCNKCETVFEMHTPLSRLSLVVFWLLICPTILVLIVLLFAFLHAIFAP